MQDFYFTYPVRIYFGDKALKRAEHEFDKIASRVLLVYGKGSIKRNGLYDEIIALLRSKNKEIVEFKDVMPNPTYAKVLEGIKIAKENKIDFILAVGGGSVIDCAKVIATGACYEEDLWEMEFNKKIIPQRSLPLGAILTAAGTGSEMNDIGVITNDAVGIKKGMKVKAPLFSILDVGYTLSLKRRQLFSGAFDTLSHSLECYFGNSDRDCVSDDIALAIAKNCVMNIYHLLNDENDLIARRNLMWDSAMAENGLTKIGKDLDFMTHKMEHQLAVYTDCNHGEGLAIIQPAYYEYIKDKASEKMLKMSKVVFDKNTIDEGLKAFRKLIKDMGLPASFKELRSRVTIDDEILEKVASSVSIVTTVPYVLNREEILEILKSCR